MDEPAEVALEDYARVLTRSQARPRRCPPRTARAWSTACTSAARSSRLARGPIADIEGFARSLLAGRAGGLGWS